MKFSLAQAHASATQFGTWMSYSGSARLVLAAVLLAFAAAAVYLARRLRKPLRPVRPGPAVTAALVAVWVAAIIAFLICAHAYVHQLRRDHLLQAPPTDPIAPVTLICAAALFAVLVISGAHKPRGWVSAAVAALAAPMVFELPFDLIVMARTYPAVPPDPALYRLLFFAPLFLIEIATLALLTISPQVRLTRATLACFALMLAVFAVWSLAGFSYPDAPVPVLLNATSKVLAFVTTLTLFLPLRASESAPPAAPWAGMLHVPAEPAADREDAKAGAAGS
jgi:hypothetical protein